MNTIVCRVHAWEKLEDGTWACSECEATALACRECGEALTRRDEVSVCGRCVEYWERIVGDVFTAAAFGQDPYTPLASPRMDPNRVSTSEDDTRLPFGLDAWVNEADAPILRLKTVAAALGVLDAWVVEWDRGPLTGEGLVRWALENPGTSRWSEFSVELRQVRSVVRRLVGMTPVREPVPCVHCGGRIVREWTRDGLAELRRCTGCGMEWPEYASLAHTNHLVLQGLPETHPSLHVTLEEANRIFRGRVAPNQVHMWVKRHKLLPVDRNFRGDEVYLLGDVTALVEKNEARKSGSSVKVRA